MCLVIHFDQFFHRDLCVDLSSREAGVAEKFLNIAEVSAGIEKMRGKGMTQTVRGNMAVYLGADSDVFIHHPAN